MSPSLFLLTLKQTIVASVCLRCLHNVQNKKCIWLWNCNLHIEIHFGIGGTVDTGQTLVAKHHFLFIYRSNCPWQWHQPMNNMMSRQPNQPMVTGRPGKQERSNSSWHQDEKYEICILPPCLIIIQLYYQHAYAHAYRQPITLFTIRIIHLYPLSHFRYLQRGAQGTVLSQNKSKHSTTNTKRKNQIWWRDLSISIWCRLSLGFTFCAATW